MILMMSMFGTAMPTLLIISIITYEQDYSWLVNMDENQIKDNIDRTIAPK